MESLNEPGRYRFKLLGWGIRKSNTTLSRAFSFTAIALGKYDESGVYTPLNDQPQKCSGDIWFIGKDGKRRELEIQFLRTWLSWDGTAEPLLIPAEEPGALEPVEFTGLVKLDEYQSEKGSTSYRIDRIEGDRPTFVTPSGEQRKMWAEELQAELDGRPPPRTSSDEDMSFP